jgi:exopolysaccharide biosynthesis polyprenyl glycosylphosphotransferase
MAEAARGIRIETPFPPERPAADVGVAPSPAGALRKFRWVTTALVVLDGLCIISAVLIVNLVRSGAVTTDVVLVTIIAPIIWAAVFSAFGLYGIRHLPASDEFRRLISAVTVGVFLVHFTTVWWDASPDRVSLGLVWSVALLMELVARRLGRWYVRQQKRTRRMAFRTLIVGTNQEAERIARALEAPVRGFIPLGFVAGTVETKAPEGMTVLSTISEIDHAIRDHAAECVFVASTAVSEAEMRQISTSCRRSGIELRVSANLPEVLTSRLAVQQIHNEVMAVSVRPATLTRAQMAAKRTFDLLLGSFALVLLSPAMALTAVLIKMTSAGPVLFRQERVTQGGRTFTMFKFRTMVTDPDAALEGRLIDLTQPFFKLPNDPRLTAVGRILRASSLDELPQLWNVLLGDMSLVGPRPLPAEQVAANVEILASRHEVRAGITGWWQISGRSEVDVDEALRMDMFYIENWSLTLDLYILLKTVGAVIARRGAY